MRIQDVMSKRVVSVTPATKIGDARERLRTEEIDHLVVVEGTRIVGVVAGKDILGASDDGPIAEVMSREVVTIEPGEKSRGAARGASRSSEARTSQTGRPDLDRRRLRARTRAGDRDTCRLPQAAGSCDA